MALKSDVKFEEKLAGGLRNDVRNLEHLKVSKLGLWRDPFVRSRECVSLKFTDQWYVMTMKNDAKFEEELTCHFKIDMRNLKNFDSNTRKSKKDAL